MNKVLKRSLGILQVVIALECRKTCSSRTIPISMSMMACPIHSLSTKEVGLAIARDASFWASIH